MNDGIMLVNKPRGISSARAVAQLKRQYAARKVGHGGALDPLADGLLVVLFGQATGFARFCLGADKTYRAQVRLGMQTTTDDSEGEVIFSAKPPPDVANRVRELLPGFIGTISQTAPQYSALKHRGEPLYKRARRGESATAKIRTLRVVNITMENADEASGDILSFNICAQSGFYVRAFARDIGELLGCGGHLASLTRTASGAFSLADATPLQTLLNEPPNEKHILPIALALTFLPMLQLPLEQITKMAHGQIPADKNESANERAHLNAPPTRIYSPAGRFAGVASGAPLKPLRFLQWTRTEIINNGRP